MNALQPSPPPSRQAATPIRRSPQPVSRPTAHRSPQRTARRPVPRTAHRTTHRTTHQTIALELAARLGVNLILGVIAVSALARLLPYNLTQQAQLKQLQVEVAEVETRVDHLRAEFNRNFDPQQAMSVMQEQSARMHPNQRQVIWIAPASTIAEEPVEEEVRQNRRQTWTAWD
jgi:hypothetical protein